MIESPSEAQTWDYPAMTTVVGVLFMVAIAGAVAFAGLAFRKKDAARPGRGERVLLVAWMVALTAVALFVLLWVLGALLLHRLLLGQRPRHNA